MNHQAFLKPPDPVRPSKTNSFHLARTHSQTAIPSARKRSSAQPACSISDDKLKKMLQTLCVEESEILSKFKLPL